MIVLLRVRICTYIHKYEKRGKSKMAVSHLFQRIDRKANKLSENTWSNGARCPPGKGRVTSSYTVLFTV